jgi:DNA-binding NarL/FixJ family response regulator
MRPLLRVAGQPVAHTHADQRLLEACRTGHEPAEALPTYAREWLVHELVREGWTDVQIADWTRMTTYTTARIRARLDLTPNAPRAQPEVA